MSYAFDRRRMAPYTTRPASGPAAVSPVPRLPVRLSYTARRGHMVEESLAMPLLPAEQGICAVFARGTLIATPEGATAVEDLVPGDAVLTRDTGVQPLAWIGSVTLRLRAGETAQPAGALRVVSGGFGPLLPEPDLVLHESAHILMPQAAEDGRRGSVLVPLADLADDHSVFRLRPPGPIEFFNLAFETHQIICANGLAVESFHPARVLGAAPSSSRETLARLFPYLDGDLPRFGRPCRPYRGSAGTSAA